MILNGVEFLGQVSGESSLINQAIVKTNDTGVLPELVNVGTSKVGQRRLRTETCTRQNIRELQFGNADRGIAHLDEDLIQCLLKYGNNPEGIPILHYAIKVGDETAVAILLKNNTSEVNCDSKFGTPIQIALKSRSYNIVKMLAQSAKYVVNEQDLISCTNYNCHEGLEILLSVEQCRELRQGKILFEALFNRLVDNDTVKILINQGFSCGFWFRHSVNPVDPVTGVLTAAVWRGDVSLLELLIKNGAPISEINGQKIETPLNTAVMTTPPDLSIIKFLFEQGAKIDERIPYMYIDSALKDVKNRGTFSLMRLLLENGLGIDKDHDYISSPYPKHTLLQHAVLNKSINLVTFLLESGADPNMKKSFSKSPLVLASESGNREMIELLLRYDAKL
jgi:Ankyrin repeats (3 copies)